MCDVLAGLAARGHDVRLAVGRNRVTDSGLMEEIKAQRLAGVEIVSAQSQVQGVQAFAGRGWC